MNGFADLAASPQDISSDPRNVLCSLQDMFYAQFDKLCFSQNAGRQFAAATLVKQFEDRTILKGLDHF